MNVWKKASYMNLEKDAELLKPDHTFSRRKTIINAVHLITVSRHCDRDPHPFVLLFNEQLPQVWKLQDSCIIQLIQ